MKRIFLGPTLHWAIAAFIVGLGWYTGIGRTHVSQFNMFIIFLMILTIVVLLVILKTSPKDSQITRDPLEEEQ